jgi:hypothetical protein
VAGPLPASRKNRLVSWRLPLVSPLESGSRSPYLRGVPSADFSRRAGFPTVRLSLAALLVVVLSGGPARAALSPPPVRLALLFEREVWSRNEVLLPIPVRPGTGPIPYEVP